MTSRWRDQRYAIGARYAVNMPAPATEIDVGGTAVRVSNPDRVIYPATESSPEATKLDIVQYYVSVGDAILRALYHRPTTLERWPKGVFPDMKQATRSDRHGDAFYQKRIPKGAPAYVETAQITFPSGRVADEVCPTEAAVVAWAAQIGTLTFHPWPVRRDDVDHPDELRIDLDPQPGTDFADAVHVAGGARAAAGGSRVPGVPQDLGQPRRAHLPADRAAVDLHRRTPRGHRVRPRARTTDARRGDHEVVEGGARPADLRRLQPERPRPDHRERLQPASATRRPRVDARRPGTSWTTSILAPSRCTRSRPGTPRSAT